MNEDSIAQDLNNVLGINDDDSNMSINWSDEDDEGGHAPIMAANHAIDERVSFLEPPPKIYDDHTTSNNVQNIQSIQSMKEEQDGDDIADDEEDDFFDPDEVQHVEQMEDVQDGDNAERQCLDRIISDDEEMESGASGMLSGISSPCQDPIAHKVLSQNMPPFDINNNNESNKPQPLFGNLGGATSDSSDADSLHSDVSNCPLFQVPNQVQPEPLFDDEQNEQNETEKKKKN